MRKKLHDYPEISVDPEKLDGKIDFERFFGRSAPVEIEIGSGKATFLVHQGWANPEVNFLGIEWAMKYYRYGVDRLGRWGIKNVKMIRTDAGQFIHSHLADESVDCFHIYFPDPWHKRRHHKRRFINDTNFAQLLRILKTGGRIQIATDHEDYFRWITKVLDNYSEQVEKVDFIPAAGAEKDEFVGTNYERKFKHQRKTHATALMKK
jgi:tRNA (guanine-N7-)-methyltransferase